MFKAHSWLPQGVKPCSHIIIIIIPFVDDYFDSTVAPVYAELRRDPSSKGWARWVKKWSQFSVLEFLKSDTYQSPADKYKLRPWPQKAIEAYTVRNYIPLVNASLVEYLRELLGQWWKDPLYTPTGGMEEIAKAFMRKNTTGWNPDVDLSKDIRYGIKVEAIEEVSIGSQTLIHGENIIITLCMIIILVQSLCL